LFAHEDDPDVDDAGTVAAAAAAAEAGSPAGNCSPAYHPEGSARLVTQLINSSDRTYLMV